MFGHVMALGNHGNAASAGASAAATRTVEYTWASNGYRVRVREALLT
jgi:hypothetical protein